MLLRRSKLLAASAALAAALALLAPPMLARAEEPEWVTLPKVVTMDGRELENVQVYGYFKDVDGQRVFVEVDPSTDEEIRAYVAGSATEYVETQVLDHYDTVQREDRERWREVWPPERWWRPRNFTGTVWFCQGYDERRYWLPFPPEDDDARVAFPLSSAKFYERRIGEEDRIPAGSFPVKIRARVWSLSGRPNLDAAFTVPGGIEGWQDQIWWTSRSLNAASISYMRSVQGADYFDYARSNFLPYFYDDDEYAPSLEMVWSVLSVGDPEAPDWAKTSAEGNENGAHRWASDEYFSSHFYSSYIMLTWWGNGVYYDSRLLDYVVRGRPKYSANGYLYSITAGIVHGPVVAYRDRWVPVGLDPQNPDIEYGKFEREAAPGYAIDVVRLLRPWVVIDWDTETLWAWNPNDYPAQLSVNFHVSYDDAITPSASACFGSCHKNYECPHRSGSCPSCHGGFNGWQDAGICSYGDNTEYNWYDPSLTLQPHERKTILDFSQWEPRDAGASSMDYSLVVSDVRFLSPGLSADGGYVFLPHWQGPWFYLEGDYPAERFSDPRFWRPNVVTANGLYREVGTRHLH